MYFPAPYLRYREFENKIIAKVRLQEYVIYEYAISVLHDLNFGPNVDTNVWRMRSIRLDLSKLFNDLPEIKMIIAVYFLVSQFGTK